MFTSVASLFDRDGAELLGIELLKLGSVLLSWRDLFKFGEVWSSTRAFVPESWVGKKLGMYRAQEEKFLSRSLLPGSALLTR